MIRLRCSLIVGLAISAASAGCGRETYLTRLEETRKYFAYEQRLNENLTPVAWQGKNFLLRVPKQFEPISAKSKTSSEGDRDPRQPTFADVELPGLQGAWKASLPLTGGEGRGPAYLYLLSNFEMLAKSENEEKAANFNDSVIRTVAVACGQSVPALEKLPLLEVPRKADDSYVDKLKYRTVSPGLSTTVNDKPYRVRIYAYKKEKSPAQISLVYVLPESAAAADKLDRAIEMSLETLKVTQDKPSAVPGATPGKGRPSGAGKGI